MTVSVFVGTSVDGFIARPNGEFDFLPAGGGEPHGYEEFMASVDALVIGRNTQYPLAPQTNRPVCCSGPLLVFCHMARDQTSAVLRTCMSTEGSPFNGSSAQDWFNASLSPEFPCS
jgi:hypothetical protein